MALIDKLGTLADSVRERTGLEGELTITEMAEAVKAIAYPVVEQTTITENGVYTPDSGVDGFNRVEVDVYIPTYESGSLTITENGDYRASRYGYDGFSEVAVRVPIPEVEPAVIQEISITENGTYSAPVGVDGYNPIIVNVPTGEVLKRSEEVEF